jgi:hypothetical protein
MKSLILIIAFIISTVYIYGQTIKVGSKVEFMALDGNMYKGTIKEIVHTAYKVEYDGFDGQYTWMTLDQFKPTATVSPNKVGTKSLPDDNKYSAWQVGSKVEAFSSKKWYSGTIAEIKDGKYKIRYDGYSEYWDTWVTNNELRPTGSNDNIKVSLDKAAKGKLYLRHIRWLTNGNTSLNWYFLADNGTIVVDPIHGVNPVNLYEERQDNMKNMGTYVLTNNSLKVKWLNGTASDVEVEYKNGDLCRIDALSLVMRQKGVPANFKLNGTYSGVLSAGSVSGGRSFSFSNRGTFSVVNTGYISSGAGSGTSTAQNSGTYTISGNTLTLNFNDGKIEKSAIAIWDNRVVINNTSLPLVGN